MIKIPFITKICSAFMRIYRKEKEKYLAKHDDKNTYDKPHTADSTLENTHHKNIKNDNFFKGPPKIYNFNTNDIRLDMMIAKIQDTCKKVDIYHPCHPQVQQIREKYLPQIVNAYLGIPPAQRRTNYRNRNAYDMTTEQLNTLCAGLEEILQDCLKEKHHALRVNGKMLQEIFHRPEL